MTLILLILTDEFCSEFFYILLMKSRSRQVLFIVSIVLWFCFSISYLVFWILIFSLVTHISNSHFLFQKDFGLIFDLSNSLFIIFSQTFQRLLNASSRILIKLSIFSFRSSSLYFLEVNSLNGSYSKMLLEILASSKSISGPIEGVLN